MRCLDNGTITHEEIDELKDMVEYYVTDNEDEDSGFDCVDETYAPLLDRLNDVTLGLQSATITSKAKKVNDLEEEQAEREREKERAAAAAVKAQLLAHGSNAATVVEEEKKAPARPTPISASSSQSSIKRRVSISETPSGNHVTSEEIEGTSPPSAKNAVLGGAAAKNEPANGAMSFALAAAGRNTTTTTTTTTPTTTATTAAQGQRTLTVWDTAKGKEMWVYRGIMKVVIFRGGWGLSKTGHRRHDGEIQIAGTGRRSETKCKTRSAGDGVAFGVYWRKRIVVIDRWHARKCDKAVAVTR